MTFLDKAGLERLWAHILLKLNRKVDKIDGKGLSTNDFTNEDKEKLNNIMQSDWSQTDETKMDFIKNKPNENDALALLVEMGLITPAVAADGTIFVDNEGAIYTL